MNEHSAYTVLTPLDHLLITHTSFMCQSNAFSSRPSFPIISRPLSSCFSSNYFLYYKIIFFCTHLAMPPCTVVQVVHCTRSACPMGKWRLKSNLCITCQAPPGTHSSPLKGGTFCNSSKGTVWASDDPAFTSPHGSTQHPSQRLTEQELI